ncbi:hypothetical protein JG654_03480 [Vibrio cholerae]|uniref:hypothetical protein n=1 Tax=Vibrio cholerae TaxID=666 RepID=UPI0018F08C7A|nr:hypothetical protein [Vibrio cholerae]MBJ6955413.1 hypothetical protein [Vibrio cholerae]MBJ6959854.1 hypothetical protein [Vibrio cholerae]
MNQYRDAVISSEQMIILKKFDEAANYLYPILQNAPRAHGVLRNKILDAILEQAAQLIEQTAIRHKLGIKKSKRFK